LWVRLAVITTFLVATGLLLAGVASTTLLHRFLVDQVDNKLTSQAAARSTLDLALGAPHPPLPTDYAVLVLVGDESTLYVDDTVAVRYGRPNLPLMTPDEARSPQRPFTVGAEGSSVPWRAVAYPVQVGPDRDGAVVVALPLGDVEQTTRQMTTVLLGSGAAIVTLAAVAGALAARRSLRPVRQIEATAAAIAAGDLSQRVPPAPLSTEVGRLGAALNGMLAQIEQASAARGASEARMRQFVADASDELRTPLAAVRGYAELYRTGGPTALDAREALERVEESAQRMDVLVENLITVTRLDQTQAEPDEARTARREPVDLAVLAADAASDLRVLDATRQVQVVGLSGEVSPCLVVGDEHQLRQVLTNLVGNVVAHTPEGSPVELAVGHDHTARMGTVEVRDHGPGISDEHSTDVFRRFSRVDPSRTCESGGAGLGLAIVAAVVAAHHGEVTLVPTPDGGATIRVQVPLASVD